MNNEMTTDNMSNEEVIEVLKGIVFNGFDRTTRKERQALDLAIKALEERPQGECKNCKHFKESLCENSPNGWCSIRRATQEGDLETQVPKDYYCSWYEKGGAE